MALVNPKEVNITYPLRVYKVLRKDATSVPRGYEYSPGREEPTVKLQIETATHPSIGEIQVIYEGYHAYKSIESLLKDYEEPSLQSLKKLTDYEVGEFEIPASAKAYESATGRIVSNSIKFLGLI